MNKETKLILENQKNIMRYLWSTENSKIKMFEDNLFEQIGKTNEALNPKESDTEQRIKDSLDEGSEKEDSTK